MTAAPSHWPHLLRQLCSASQENETDRQKGVKTKEPAFHELQCAPGTEPASFHPSIGLGSRFQGSPLQGLSHTELEILFGSGFKPGSAIYCEVEPCAIAIFIF